MQGDAVGACYPTYYGNYYRHSTTNITKFRSLSRLHNWVVGIQVINDNQISTQQNKLHKCVYMYVHFYNI